MNSNTVVDQQGVRPITVPPTVIYDVPQGTTSVSDLPQVPLSVKPTITT